MLHCLGHTGGQKFFAKVFVADMHPLLPYQQPLWNDHAGSSWDRRAADEVELEWYFTNQFRSFAGANCVPAPLAKSLVEKTIVWEQLSGSRLDRLFRGWLGSTASGGALNQSLFEAGVLLRKVHDRSVSGSENVCIADVTRRARELMGELGDSRCVAISLRRLETELSGIEEHFQVPVALSHGDFCLPNLIYRRDTRTVFLVDFEHAASRPVLADLVSMICSLRTRLLNPFPRRALVEAAEQSFWAGYGRVSEDWGRFVNAVAGWQVLFRGLMAPASGSQRRLGTFLRRRAYETLFQKFVAPRSWKAAPSMDSRELRRAEWVR
jgi:hypothetical protein